jgi:type IV secretory pathway VirB3-like protein
MATPTYRSINVTATLLGIDRRLCIVILIIAFLVFRHFTFLSALFVFALLWSGAYWVTKHDPELVVIVPKALGQRCVYDPGKATNKKGGLELMSRRSSSPLQDAGSCAEQIALLRFIDDITFETKLGDLGMLLSLSGIDPDCRTDEMLVAFTRRYESAMRLFDDRFRVYSYIVKPSGASLLYRERYATEVATAAVHPRAKGLEARAGSSYEIKLYLAVLYEAFRRQKKFLGSVARASEEHHSASGTGIGDPGRRRAFVSVPNE